MDTLQLTTFIINDPVCSPIFLGVFPADKLPKIKTVDLEKPCCVIANTDIASKSGTHWVAIYINQDICMFFDSYGRLPQPRFKKFLRQPSLISRRLEVNNKCIQGFNSTLCGQYCLFFLYKVCRGYSLNSIVSVFKTNDTHGNDLSVKQWFQCMNSKTKYLKGGGIVGGVLFKKKCRHLQKCKPFQCYMD